MTTNTYSTVIAHTTDAEFRAWGSALAASMQAAGLVQTADTGQINWASVVRPAVNTAGGYEIYRFNDALQGTYPIFIKIEYGTHSSATIPGIWITAATGSNGAGTLTGTSSTRNTAVGNAAPLSTVTAYPTYVCVKNGFLGVFYKLGAQASAPICMGFYAVARTTDDSGAETGDGFTVYRRQTSAGTTPTAQAVSVSNATTFTASTSFALVHHDVTSSLVGTDKQVYKNYTVQPRVRPVLQMATVLSSEYSAGTSFTAALVGATARTYLSAGGGVSHFSAATTPAHSAAMLWE